MPDLHIAYDGGCFQQTILGGIYHVACNFLNTSKALAPNLRVTLIGDPRQGIMRPAALSGLSWQPEIMYAPIGPAYGPPARWPTLGDANVRLFVDGAYVAAETEDGTLTYRGLTPKKSLAIVSRAARPVDSGKSADRRSLGVSIRQISIGSGSTVRILKGQDRRLSVGFHEPDGITRWTDGAGFIPTTLFAGFGDEVNIHIDFTEQDEYAYSPGLGADLVLRAKRVVREELRNWHLRTLSGALKNAGCSIYFANHFIPAHLPELHNVAWAYDLIPVLLPQYFHADAQENFQANLDVFRRADRVYAISEATRNDMLEKKVVEPEKVIATGIAASSGIVRRSDVEIEATLPRFYLHRDKYILCVATIEPRKNHMRLMQAYLHYRKQRSESPDLVFVGKMGWDYQPVLNFREEHGLSGVIKIFSDLVEEDLACLYSGALFSAYLSVYEGFGLPIVEAMACGCAVLTSNTSSMPEIAGNAALLADPYDVGAMADAFGEMTDNSRLRSELVRRGQSRVSKYQWINVAGQILPDLEKIACSE